MRQTDRSMAIGILFYSIVGLKIFNVKDVQTLDARSRLIEGIKRLKWQ